MNYICILMAKKHFALLQLIFCLLSQSEMSGQSPFSASIFLGTNASQINGDKLAGYHKVGISGGVGVQYKLSDRWDFGAELLYSQRGSRNALFPAANRNFYIKMDYAELPVVVHLKDWYVEDGKYYKVKAHSGFSFANIISSETNIDIFNPKLDVSRNRDFSFIIGVDYFFTKKWGMSIRYTRSLYPFYVDPVSSSDNLLNYFLTIRAEYTL